MTDLFSYKNISIFFQYSPALCSASRQPPLGISAEKYGRKTRGGKEETAKANDEFGERKEQSKAKNIERKEKSFVCWETQKKDNKYRFFLF